MDEESELTSSARAIHPKRVASPTRPERESRKRVRTSKALEATTELDSDELEAVLEAYESHATSPRRVSRRSRQLTEVPPKAKDGTSTRSASPSESIQSSRDSPSASGSTITGPSLNPNREAYFWHEPTLRLLPIGNELQFASPGRSWKVLSFPPNSYYGPPLPSDMPDSTFARQQPCVSSCRFTVTYEKRPATIRDHFLKCPERGQYFEDMGEIDVVKKLYGLQVDAQRRFRSKKSDGTVDVDSPKTASKPSITPSRFDSDTSISVSPSQWDLKKPMKNGSTPISPTSFFASSTSSNSPPSTKAAPLRSTLLTKSTTEKSSGSSTTIFPGVTLTDDGDFEPIFSWTPINAATSTSKVTSTNIATAAYDVVLGYFCCSFCKTKVTKSNLTDDVILSYHVGVRRHLQNCSKIGVAQASALKLWEAGKDFGDGRRRRESGLVAKRPEVVNKSERKEKVKHSKKEASVLVEARPRSAVTVQRKSSNTTQSRPARNKLHSLSQSRDNEPSPPSGPSRPSSLPVLSEEEGTDYGAGVEKEDGDSDRGKGLRKKKKVEVASKKQPHVKKNKLAGAAAASAAKRLEKELEQKKSTQGTVLLVRIHGDPSLFPLVAYALDTTSPPVTLRSRAISHHAAPAGVISTYLFKVPESAISKKALLRVILESKRLMVPHESDVLLRETELMSLIVQDGELMWKWGNGSK